MHKRGLCRHAVSVRLHVTFVYSVKMSNHMLRPFSLPSSRTIPVFPYQILWRYFNGTGTRVTEASNAGV